MSRANRRKRFSNPDLDLRIPSITAGLTGVIDFRHNAVDILRRADPSTQSISANGTRVNPATGLVEQAVANVTRIEKEGGRFEPAGTNHLVQSVMATDAGAGLPTGWAWFSSGSLAIEDSTLTSIGKANKQTASAERPYLYQTTGELANGSYVLSMIVEDGSVSTSGGLLLVLAGTATIANVSAAVTDTSAGTKTMTFDITSPGTVTARCGLGVSSNATGWLRFSMPQLNLGSARGSYIPTAASAVTRDADDVRYADAGALLNPDQGTVMVAVENVVTPSGTGRAHVFSSLGAGSASHLFLYRTEGGWTQEIYNDAGFQAARSIADAGSPAMRVLAVTWTTTSFGLGINGGAQSVASFAASARAFRATLGIGQSAASIITFNGNIGPMCFFDRALSDAEIAYIYQNDYIGRWKR